MKKKIIGATVGSQLPKPNMAQSDPRKGDYVRNRTHWEEDNRTTVNWNGNTTGRRTYTNPLGETYYKISDKCPAEEDVVGATIELSNGNTLTVSSKMFSGYGDNGQASAGSYLYLISRPINYGTVIDTNSVGVYASAGAVYPTEFRWGQYTVHPLDEKFIPDSIARKIDIPEGTVTDEQIAQAVEDYMAEHPIEIPDSGQNPAGGGLSSDASALLITILKSAGYKTDQTANIAALEELLASSADSSATVSSVTAVFNQGNKVIYTTDSLATLRDYLVVTAKYGDGTEKTVSGYTLSGTLTEGTSTITVSYVGKTTTFTCTVTKPTTDTGNLDNITIDSGVMTINAIADAVISDGVMTVA